MATSALHDQTPLVDDLNRRLGFVAEPSVGHSASRNELQSRIIRMLFRLASAVSKDR